MNRILSFISDNASWIFSGIGLFIVSGIFALVRFLLKKKTANSIQGTNNGTINFGGGNQVIVESLYIDSSMAQNPRRDAGALLDLDPAYIRSKKDHLSLVEFQEFVDSLVGNRIQWKGEVATVSKRDRHYRLQVCFDDENFRAFFSVGSDENPNVRLFRSHDPVLLSGKIAKIDGSTVDLEDARIEEWTPKESSRAKLNKSLH